MPRKFAQRFALSLMLCPLMLSCQTTGSAATEPKVVDSFCAVAKPIAWSRQDTRETATQVQEHNTLGKKLCGWGTSPPPAKFPNSEAATPPL